MSSVICNGETMLEMMAMIFWQIERTIIISYHLPPLPLTELIFDPIDSMIELLCWKRDYCKTYFTLIIINRFRMVRYSVFHCVQQEETSNID